MSSTALGFLVIMASALLVIGFLLSIVSNYVTSHRNQGSDMRIEKLLPGINCGQCGYPGCHAYAEALAKGEASPNLCKPAGPEVANQLATITGKGSSQSDFEEELFMPRQVAFIHQNSCTGCGRCVRVCRLDAIEGKVRQSHKVINEECIGCGDCISKCPEKCIEMIRLEQTLNSYNWRISVSTNGNKNK